MQLAKYFARNGIGRLLKCLLGCLGLDRFDLDTASANFLSAWAAYFRKAAAGIRAAVGLLPVATTAGEAASAALAFSMSPCEASVGSAAGAAVAALAATANATAVALGAATANATAVAMGAATANATAVALGAATANATVVALGAATAAASRVGEEVMGAGDVGALCVAAQAGVWLVAFFLDLCTNLALDRAVGATVGDEWV